MTYEQTSYRGYDLVQLPMLPDDAEPGFVIYDGDEEVDRVSSLNEAQAVINDWLANGWVF